MAQTLVPNDWNNTNAPLGQEYRQMLSQLRNAVASHDKITVSILQIPTDAEMAVKFGITEAEATTLRAVISSAQTELESGTFLQQELANYN